MAAESKRVIIAAVAGNLAIAITKFVAAAVSGSSALLSEAIHSSVDTGDSLLLLLGMRLSKRGPDAKHPFGHGLDLYFWSFVVAIMIFGVGGGVSIYEGILHILDAKPMRSHTTVYVVLAISFVFEGATWLVARRGFNKARGRRGVWETIRTTKDPSIFTVVFEDTAALLGIAVAALGIGLGEVLGIPELDGAASIVIGCILSTVAVLLAIETRSLLLGESADPKLVRSVHEIVHNDPTIEDARAALTMHFGPEDILLNLEVSVDGEAASDPHLAHALRRLEREIQQRHPRIKHVFFRLRPAGQR
jgi:cation diffusion facilitator family transporter